MHGKKDNPGGHGDFEQFAVEVDYSKPAGDDYDKLARDAVFVRSLRGEDLEAVVRIDHDITGSNRRAFYESKFGEVLFETGLRISLIAETDGRVAGFMMARLDFGEFGRTASEAVIDSLGVARAFREQKVGHALLSQLLTNLATLRVETVRTEVEWDNFDLLGFLQSCGFAPSQRLALSSSLV